MNTTEIIALIDAEIAKLERARVVITGAAKNGKVRHQSTITPKPKKRNLTPEGRARIAAAVKARWARQRKAKK